MLAVYNFKVEYLKCVDFAENPIAPQVFFTTFYWGDYPVMCHFAYFASKLRKIPLTLTTERTYTPKGFKGIALRLLDHTFNKIVRNGVDVYTAHCTAARRYCIENLEARKNIITMPPSIDIFSAFS